MSSGLEYRMPEKDTAKVAYLCQILNLEKQRFKDLPDRKLVGLLSDVILYHHVPRMEQRQILKRLTTLPGPLHAKLRSKVATPLVQPLWSVWSLPTQELFEYQELFDTIASFGNFFGYSFSAMSAKEMIAKVKSLPDEGGRTPITLASTVLIWGFFWNNESARQTIQQEINRRAGKKFQS
ncbi:hypothetical protein [Halospina sp. K52047b]|uniref:hypothetical protein n=1 Tax=Halospina sp. K52047b TaxID=2614160 RepID=UPI00124ACFCD|nr:hypothetical protein [Halospina sp. K52047b]KAA8979322.1 hypothetical protein F3089_13125 [Halospina sp. K52047b]